MIKTENSTKIPKNPRNFPQKTRNFRKKSLKNPKNFPLSFARRMGEGSGFAVQGGICQKNFCTGGGGYFEKSINKTNIITV